MQAWGTNTTQRLKLRHFVDAKTKGASNPIAGPFWFQATAQAVDLLIINDRLRLVIMTDSTMPCPQFVAYYRVSTDKQGKSGLGLEAQINAVQQHIQRSGGAIIAEFQEVESGKHNDRPQLQAALKLCRQKKAVLVIAKIDRLARNVAFIANLMESKVTFIACDNPHANKTMSQMMAVFAEHERDAISQRTKDALQAAKARGVKLGRPDADIAEVQRHWSERARSIRERVYPTAQEMRNRGMTLTQIADDLNDRGIKTCRSGQWYASTVGRLLKEAA